MIADLARKLFGSKNDREVKRIMKKVQLINSLESQMQALKDEDFANKTKELKERVQNGESLDKVLPEAFALVREASVRVLKMRHFDVQLVGAVVLHEGKIAEMRTGEGKTLVATLAVYLNALAGKGVHIVTVNEYLASRDANWMKPLYEFLGLSVGVISSLQDINEKLAAYRADITYGTNNEFGFDYLRDNMVVDKSHRMQRELYFAVVDEVDSILIDEARTPLIISGQAEDSSELYKTINSLIVKLNKQEEEIVDNLPKVIKEGHFKVDEKTRQIELTESGHQFIEELLIQGNLMQEDDSLYTAKNLNLLTHTISALKAHYLFHKNVEYVVQNDEVLLIDENTGRLMQGRRLSDGLHQAIEAKENLTINPENQTLASTTFQNYFRLYEKLSGMTGTADTEAYEFKHIYNLDVVVIPTNKAIARIDYQDTVFATKEEKYQAIIKDIQATVEKKRPVLVGTASIETSEYLSSLLVKAKIKHQVLNAKQHEQEAHIIAQAGKAGSVTIATNMAGRGTDIVLGGNLEADIANLGENANATQIEELTKQWQQRNKEVLEAGGLHVISSERHESRRIDNQLRGRAGRQGDAGSSHFYLSLEDNLMRIFASDAMRAVMQKLGLKNGESIEHKMVSNAIEKAQRRVEERNFEIRKQLLEYDDVANEQRRVVYSMRDDLLEEGDIKETIAEFRNEVLNEEISKFIPFQSLPDMWNVKGLTEHLANNFALFLPIEKWLEEDKDLVEESLRDKIEQAWIANYIKVENEFDANIVRNFEKQTTLQVLDNLWKDHLLKMDNLRSSIHLRGYANKNPKQEYKRESFDLFKDLLDKVHFETVRILSFLHIRTQEELDIQRAEFENHQQNGEIHFEHQNAHSLIEDDIQETQETNFQVINEVKVGRNEPCPCGSGKKYKQCHGKIS